MTLKTLFYIYFLVAVTTAHQSATEVFSDIYSTCLKDFSLSCVRPKAMSWMDQVADDQVIRITEDLSIVKDQDVPVEEQRGARDVFDKFDEFISTHRLVAKLPSLLGAGGEFNHLVPRAFNLDDEVNVPLAATGRSKFVKKVMIPFLLGLKFKTAVLVPLAIALIALKTWKAMTLGLLSLVLTGAIVIFKFTKPKIINYEVVHYPHHHHVDHHVEPVPAIWDHHHPVHARELSGNQLAYSAHQS